jgi:hypothetical protein
MIVYDWLIQHKKNKMFLGKDGLTEKREDALSATFPRQPYVKADVIKRTIFKKCKLRGLKFKDFKIACGINERRINKNERPKNNFN